MLKYYLLTYSDNWSDELDLDGHVVLNEDEYKEFQKALAKTEGFTFCFGSNEEIYYNDQSSVECAINVEEITEKQFLVLEELGLTLGGFAASFLDCLYDSVDSFWGKDNDDDDIEEDDGFSTGFYNDDDDDF